MKTEEEIRKEIDTTIKTLKKYHEEYQKRKIPFDVMSDKAKDCHTTIGALKWVLGEMRDMTNAQYDDGTHKKYDAK